VKVVVEPSAIELNHPVALNHAITTNTTPHSLNATGNARRVKEDACWRLHNFKSLTLEALRDIGGKTRTEAYDMVVVLQGALPTCDIYLCAKLHTTILGQRYTNNRKNTYLCTIIYITHS
jgi:hypothetical protein